MFDQDSIRFLSQNYLSINILFLPKRLTKAEYSLSLEKERSLKEVNRLQLQYDIQLKQLEREVRQLKEGDTNPIKKYVGGKEVISLVIAIYRSFYTFSIIIYFRSTLVSPLDSRLDDVKTRFLIDDENINYFIPKAQSERMKQKRSTEGCSIFKSPETRQVQERLVSTLEHMQVPKWDRTRCPEE